MNWLRKQWRIRVGKKVFGNLKRHELASLAQWMSDPVARDIYIPLLEAEQDMHLLEAASFAEAGETTKAAAAAARAKQAFSFVQLHDLSIELLQKKDVDEVEETA